MSALIGTATFDRWGGGQPSVSIYKGFSSVQFKTDGIYALGNALHPVSPHNGFPNVAFKTVPVFA